MVVVNMSYENSLHYNEFRESCRHDNFHLSFQVSKNMPDSFIMFCPGYKQISQELGLFIGR